MDELAIQVPSLNAYNQFIWPPAVAMPWAPTEVEQYSYRQGQAIDLRPIMPVMQFRMTHEAGTYLCAAQGLVFEGSILAYCYIVGLGLNCKFIDLLFKRSVLFFFFFFFIFVYTLDTKYPVST